MTVSHVNSRYTYMYGYMMCMHATFARVMEKNRNDFFKKNATHPKFEYQITCHLLIGYFLNLFKLMIIHPIKKWKTN